MCDVRGLLLSHGASFNCFNLHPEQLIPSVFQRFSVDAEGQLRPGQGTAIDWRAGQNVTLCVQAKHEVASEAHRHHQQHKRRNHHHFAGSKDAIRQRSGTKVRLQSASWACTLCLSCSPRFFQLVSRDSFFHFFVEGAAGGAGVRVSVGEDGEEGGAVMDEDGQVGCGSDDGDSASH